MKPEYQAYYEQHKGTLEQMKRDAIDTIPCQRSHTKMHYNCACGAKNIVVKNLQFHFISAKHRSVCGSLGDATDK
jgi:hypothetical protein